MGDKGLCGGLIEYTLVYFEWQESCVNRKTRQRVSRSWYLQSTFGKSQRKTYNVFCGFYFFYLLVGVREPCHNFSLAASISNIVQSCLSTIQQKQLNNVENHQIVRLTDVQTPVNLNNRQIIRADDLNITEINGENKIFHI